jgi:phosphoglycolate phosphatase-like HAD superfamily hydrolase
LSLNQKLADAELFMFDLDGTLVEFHHEYLLNEAERILEILNHPAVSREELHAGFRMFDFFRFVDETILPLNQFREDFWKNFKAHEIPNPILLEGVQDLLVALKGKGKKLALVTSRFEPYEKVCKSLEHCGILEFFDSVVSKNSHEHHWADKCPQISETLIKLAVPASKAVMIGDVPRDASSARLSGVSVVISLLSGGLDRSVLEAENPDFLLDGVHQILSLFLDRAINSENSRD